MADRVESGRRTQEVKRKPPNGVRRQLDQPVYETGVEPIACLVAHEEISWCIAIQEMTDQFAARRPQVSRADLVRDLKTIGVRRGDHLAVGVAYKRVGSVEGGPGALIDALVEAVGPDGTLMMNTFTEFFYEVEVARGWVDYVFDVDSTRGITGIVPETLRMRLDSLPQPPSD